MIHFDLPKQKSSIIKVFGIGGGGSNAVNYMYAQDIEGVDFVVCNTDAKAIEQSPVLNKIQLGPASTQGLGAGANPEVGKIATEESLQEIKSILEVNTRMAFITAGMGGGTGTGGAPIVAKMCKELGILTVGIVTTPFSFEGPRRLQQAKEGIDALKPHVDTLLVIDNDKLRMQYGNLKMREAFGKADNVLATAAKCITDIINSKGHIIVDFADVCTVMKNGGVAILGSAACEGENRAQNAIEEALNSPLLNDSEIKGAKWILININSAEGDDECTMDELDIINEYLRTQAGEHADVIVGMGTDNSLDKKIGITIIATGFAHKDPFAKKVEVKEQPKEEKIVLTLGLDTEEKKIVEPVAMQQAIPFEDKNPFEPQLVEMPTLIENAFDVAGYNYSANDFDAQREEVLDAKETEIFELELEASEPIETPYFGTAKIEVADNVTSATSNESQEFITDETTTESIAEMTVREQAEPPTATFLSKPSNIYSNFKIEEQIEEIKTSEFTFELFTKEPAAIVEEIATPSFSINQEESEEEFVFEVVNKEAEVTTNNENIINHISVDLSAEEEQKKRALERIQKLRNLSFNMNSADSNTEFDNVPAYVRRNMELFGNTLATVENFYSKTTVEKNDNNQTVISTKNSFLDGERPD
ncbi:MAG: cell division protein FtsZ [Chitinophagaceae bacterium]